MEMIIKQNGKKFMLYFDEISPETLCFIGYSVMSAQRRARQLLRTHNADPKAIKYILEEKQ